MAFLKQLAFTISKKTKAYVRDWKNFFKEIILGLISAFCLIGGSKDKTLFTEYFKILIFNSYK